MMSQVELWNMQEYCEQRNNERKTRRTFAFSTISMVLIIAGAILAVLSGCLIAYVVRMTLEMTGVYFLITGIGGAVIGMGMTILGMVKSDIQ